MDPASQEKAVEFPPSKYKVAQQTKPLRRWHEAIIDDMLAFPRATYAERGARLGYNATTVGLIVNSDMFKAAYAARREQYNAILGGALASKLGDIANTGLDILKEQMEKKRTSLPFAQVAETTLSVLEKLGFGEKKGVAVQVNVSNNQQSASPVISAEALAGAREKLRQVEQGRLASPEQSAKQAAQTFLSPPIQGEALEVLPRETGEG